MEKQPLVSCLCVTHNNNQMLSRAIKCFESQTYQNREMIIVYHRNLHINAAFIRKHKNENIRFLEINERLNLSLGELRNIAIKKSKGKYICIWDDDDWYHNERIERQLRALKGSHKPACVLTNIMLYNVRDAKVYCSQTRLWEASLLCERNVLIKSGMYPPLSRGEDTPLLQKLVLINAIYPLAGANLYIYMYHGQNTWNDLHFHHMMNMGQHLASSLSTSLLKVIAENRISVKNASLKLSSSKVLKELNYLHANPKYID